MYVALSPASPACVTNFLFSSSPSPLALNKVNILHIRALVKADTVVLFDTYGSADSRLHSVFLYHLEVRTTGLFQRVYSLECSTT